MDFISETLETYRGFDITKDSCITPDKKTTYICVFYLGEDFTFRSVKKAKEFIDEIYKGWN